MTILLVLAGVLATALVVALVAFAKLKKRLRYWFEPQVFDWYLLFMKNRLSSRASIPIVAVDAHGGYKYVAIKYRDKVYIRAAQQHRFHVHIVGAFVYEIGDTNVTCLGGGTIHVSATNKIVNLAGSSQGYGTDQDRNRSYALIEQHTGLKPPTASQAVA